MMRRLLVATMATMAMLWVAGCAGAPVRDTAVAPERSTVAEPSPEESRAPVAPPAVRGATTDDAVPAVTAGPLGEQSLPVASELGTGWAPYVDPGSHEAGFVGNDSWVRERDPSDLVVSLPPLGCAGASAAPALPTPVFALEGTYRNVGGDSAVGLALEFTSTAETAQFLDRFEDLLRACGDRDPSALRIRVVSASPDRLLDQRRDPAQPGRIATEVMVREGARIGVLFLDLERPAVASGLAEALSTSLRR